MESKKLIDEFLDIASIESSLSRNPLENYKIDLSQFFFFLSKKNLCFDSINHITIRDFLKHIKISKNYKANTIARKISCLKHFYKIMYQEEQILTDPMKRIELPKKQKNLPKILSLEKINLIFQFLSSNKTDENIRLTCLIELLYSTGIRVSELLSITLLDLKIDRKLDFFTNDFLVIKGKGNKERIVILNGKAIESINEYLQVRKNFGNSESKYLFQGKIADSYLTRQRFGQMLKAIALKLNFSPDEVSPHIFRHSFASHMLANGVDLRSIQELLRHESNNTTQIYTHLMSDRLKEIIFDHHPINKKEPYN